jgi:LPS sulfotransferase NodH
MGVDLTMTDINALFPDYSEIISGSKPIPVCNKPTLILAITARTGSTNLCSILEKQRIFGAPNEVLNPRGVIDNLKRKYKVETFSDYLKVLTNQPGDYFCFKSSWSDFEPISRIFNKMFPETSFVLLDRFDVVAQAISLCRATETGEWHRSNAANNCITQSTLPVELNIKLAQSFIVRLMAQKLQWESFFFKNQICAYHIYYEIMRSDWAKAANSIAKWLGREDVATDTHESGKYSRISDELNERWTAEFKEKTGLTWFPEA